jgi:hypothetical protein
MMTMMTNLMTASQRETRELVTQLVLGRPGQTISEPETRPMLPESPVSWDYDLTPLDPGIEAVLEREQTESELAVGMRERAALQQRLSQLQEELITQEATQNLSPGPWQSVPSDGDGRAETAP